MQFLVRLARNYHWSRKHIDKLKEQYDTWFSICKMNIPTLKMNLKWFIPWRKKVRIGLCLMKKQKMPPFNCSYCPTEYNLWVYHKWFGRVFFGELYWHLDDSIWFLISTKFRYFKESNILFFMISPVAKIYGAKFETTGDYPAWHWWIKLKG